MFKQKTTNKKFYGKWLYKVTILIPGARVVSYKDYDDLKNFLLGSTPNEYPHYSVMYKAWNNRFQLLNLLESINSVPADQYAKRIESNFLDLYTNDVTIFEHFKSRFSHNIRHIFIPSDRLLSNQCSDVVVANQLAHNRYRYKVYLKPHKLKGDREGKLSFLTWLDTQSDRVRISQSVRTWFLNTDWNWDRRYMFVEDEQTLMMLKLRSSEAVGKILEYVVDDK